MRIKLLATIIALFTFGDIAQAKVSDVLAGFKAAASALGLSEQAYFLNAVDTNDTATVTAMRDAAVLAGDIAFFNDALTGMAASHGLTEVSEDTTPTLGGPLETAGNAIQGTGVNVDLEQSGAGDIRFRDGTQGTAGHVWTSTGTEGEGNWAAAPAGGIASVSEDTTPSLGGDLDLNSNTVVQGANRVFHVTGTENLFAGELSGNLSLAGTRNVGLGYQSLDAVTSGGSNVAVGYLSLSNGTGLTSNTAIGASAGLSVGGFRAVYLGAGSGRLSAGSNDGVFIGNASGESADGNDQVIIGGSAAQASDGTGNVVVGRSAGAGLTTSTNTVLIGREANTSAGTASNQIAIGYQATVDAANKMRIGDDNLTTWEAAPNTTIKQASGTLTVGNGSLILDDGSLPTTIGYVWTADATSGRGSWQAAAGGIASVSEDTAPSLGGPLDIAGQKFTNGATDLFFIGGINSMFFGQNAGNGYTNPGDDNTVFGDNSLKNIGANSDGNTVLGGGACNGITVADLDNICIGREANTSDSNAVVVGSRASGTHGTIVMGTLSSATANNSVAIGFNNNVSGTNTVSLGRNADTSAANTFKVGGLAPFEITTWEASPGTTIKGADDSAADANASADLTIQPSDKTTGTGDGGNLVLQGGTSAGGTAGTVILDDGSLPTTIGYVWTATGTSGQGAWQAGTTTATATLDNEFSGGIGVSFERIGKKVTMCFDAVSNFTAGLDDFAITTSIIPAGFVPAQNRSVVYLHDANGNGSVGVNTSGTIQVKYLNWSGAANLRINTTEAPCISYLAL